MHDLALGGLGMTVGELRLRMTERELVDWRKYANQKGTPWRRIEMQLAHIAMYLHASIGKQNAKLSDYLPDDRPPQEAEVIEMEAARALPGEIEVFVPRRAA